MKKYFLFVFALVGLGIIIGELALAQELDFTGNWKINENKSDFSSLGIPGYMPDMKLEIVQDGVNIQVKTIIETPYDDVITVYKYTTDGKECKNHGNKYELTSICNWKDNILIIKGEREGARSSSIGGNAQGSIEYFTFDIIEKYSLSENKKILTVLQQFETPDGEKNITMVFDKVEKK